MEFDLNDKGEIGEYALLFYLSKLSLASARFFFFTFILDCLFCAWTDLSVDMMGLKRMLEKLGLAKTHLELKKMMSEVAGSASKDTISYHDFLNMMLGKRNAILKL